MRALVIAIIVLLVLSGCMGSSGKKDAEAKTGPTSRVSTARAVGDLGACPEEAPSTANGTRETEFSGSQSGIAHRETFGHGRIRLSESGSASLTCDVLHLVLEGTWSDPVPQRWRLVLLGCADPPTYQEGTTPVRVYANRTDLLPGSACTVQFDAPSAVVASVVASTDLRWKMVVTDAVVDE